MPYIGFADGYRFGAKDSPVLALGPSGKGKTSGSLIPSLMMSAYSLAVICSSRSDIYRATAAWLARFGVVWSYLNPKLPGAKEVRFSPLEGLTTWSTASAFGKRWMSYLDMSAVALAGEIKSQAHFRQWGGRFLAALCLWANLTGKTIFDVRDLCTDPDRVAIKKIKDDLVAMKNKEAHVASKVIGGFLRMHDGERSGVASTAAASLEPFDNEQVIASCKDADFDFEAAVEGTPDAYSNAFGVDRPFIGAMPVEGRGDAVFITTGDAEAGYMPLILEFLWRIKDAAYRRAERLEWQDREARFPVRFYLDELAASPLPALPQLLAEPRGRGVMVHGGMQSLSQAEQLYGKLGRDFLNLWRTVLVYPGIKDEATLKLISELAGDFPQEVFGSSQGQGPDWKSNVTYQFRPRLPKDEIAKGNHDIRQAVLVVDEDIDLRWVEARRYYQSPFAEMLVESCEHAVSNGLGRYPLPKLDEGILTQLGILERWKAVKAALRRD